MDVLAKYQRFNLQTVPICKPLTCIYIAKKYANISKRSIFRLISDVLTGTENNFNFQKEFLKPNHIIRSTFCIIPCGLTLYLFTLWLKFGYYRF